MMQQQRRRNVRFLAVGLVVAITALVAVGCGGGDDDSDPSSKPTRSTGTTTEATGGGASGEQATATLDVKISNVGSKEGDALPVPTDMRCTKSIPAQCMATITCPVEASEDPAGAEVCAWLAGPGAEALADTPQENEACTMQYGGREVATITGTLDGEQVDASFSRQDGCAIRRYEAVSPLWTGQVPASTDTTGGGGSGGGGDDSSSGAPATGTSTPGTDPDAPVTSPSSEPGSVDDPPSAFS